MIKNLNIAVLGWFNYLNAGDDRIGEVLIKVLQPHNVTLLKTYNLHLLKTFDLIIFPAGTWHPRHGIARNFKSWFKNVQVPYMAVGLGVETTNDHHCMSNYKYFVNHAEYILVRDQESAKALGGSNKINVGPDITWFDPFPVCKDYNVRGDYFINLRPQKNAKDVIENYNNIEAINNAKFYSLSPEDYEVALTIGFKQNEIIEFDKSRIFENAKLIYGMRFHSSIFAQQQAIPHYNLVYHEKVSSLSSNYKSYINNSKEFANVNKINNFNKSLNNELLLKERNLLLENRKAIVKDANHYKNLFLKKVSQIVKNDFKTSYKYRIINKLLRWVN